MDDTVNPYVLGLTATIVAAHISHNEISADALPVLIQSVYQSLVTAGAPETTTAVAPIPAVPIKRSVFPNFIICLEDGRKFKTLKRHLKVSFGMTPADYRLKWGLPSDYPMVAPNYTATRSSLAKSIGLGRKGSTQSEAPETPRMEELEITIAPTRRARGSRSRS